MTTFVTFLLDRTGSMSAVKSETIEAFNSYLVELRKSDNIDFTLLQFDSASVDKTCSHVHPKDAPLLSDENYRPRANTPLIDASYKTIKAVEKYLEGNPNTDTKVAITIQTDGEENASKEFSWEQLNTLIAEKKALGWDFTFIGAGIDAYHQASKMGIAKSATMSYNKNDLGATKKAFAAEAQNTAAFASGARADRSYTRFQKEAAGDAFDLSAKDPVDKASAGSDVEL